MEIWTSDWTFIENSVENLTEYLMSNELFWPMDSGIRLTIANLRLSQRRIGCYQLPDVLLEKLSSHSNVISEIQSKWLSNWSKKAEKEFNARLRQWEQFLREVSENRLHHGMIYPHEVTWRVLLELLRTEIIHLPEKEDLVLQQHDRRLKSILKIGDFVWDPTLINGFSDETFWFLYGQV